MMIETWRMTIRILRLPVGVLVLPLRIIIGFTDQSRGGIICETRDVIVLFAGLFGDRAAKLKMYGIYQALT
jgi:hypothetical protein